MEGDMTRAHIEHGSRHAWRWIVAALVLLTVAWLALAHSNASDGDRAGNVDATAVDANLSPVVVGISDGDPGASDMPGEVSGFVTFTARNRARPDADSTHHYTASGIRLLAAALGVLTPRDSSGARMFQSQLDSLRTLAEAMQDDSRGTTHANAARLAFGIAGTVMAELQLRTAPGAARQVENARHAAWGISDARPLLAQRVEVQRFFDDAAAAVQAIAAESRV
jgi:hypothetical protein